jgi:hypothetical protein
MARYSPIWKNPRKWNAEKRNDGSFFYINKAKFTSGRLPDAPMGLRKIIIFFLLSSHQHLTAGQALEYLKKRRLDSIFPVIPGELDKGIAFDNIEEKIFLLADGKLSADGIILVISKRLKSRYGKEYIAEKCADFLRRIFSRNQGLCFAKSWC